MRQAGSPTQRNLADRPPRSHDKGRRRPPHRPRHPSLTHVTPALAAVIKQTRADGYAITIGEREQGASGLSVPVFKANGELAGCLTISGPTIRMPLDRCLDWLDLLVESAEQATRLLGGRFPTTATTL
ncbi:IclR family transcriptional regulator C-terminal domain-containing protein [Kribbella sp. NPDC026596]|uniref:IclR family transcriptional regulator domain-containing protein n=1 Tax=Kribbella sp. NPDC026596 TaxID=3155122 RepID=UPI0033C42B09